MTAYVCNNTVEIKMDRSLDDQRTYEDRVKIILDEFDKIRALIHGHHVMEGFIKNYIVPWFNLAIVRFSLRYTCNPIPPKLKHIVMFQFVDQHPVLTKDLDRHLMELSNNILNLADFKFHFDLSEKMGHFANLAFDWLEPEFMLLMSYLMLPSGLELLLLKDPTPIVQSEETHSAVIINELRQIKMDLFFSTPTGGALSKGIDSHGSFGVEFTTHSPEILFAKRQELKTVMNAYLHLLNDCLSLLKL